MKRKIVSALLAAILFSFSACGNEASQQTASSEVDLSSLSESEVWPENGLPKDQEITLKMCVNEQGIGQVFLDNAVAGFMEKFPNVTIEVSSEPDAMTVIDAKVQAGDINDMFDIIESDDAKYIAAGKLEPQDDLWERSPYDRSDVTMRELTTDTYYEFSFVSGWPDGERHVAAFPCQGGTGGGLFFNKAQFEENGWNQDPKTWQEFLDLCADIRADGVDPIVVTGVYTDYMNNAFGAKPFELAERDGNLETFTENYRNWEMPLYTTPEFKETFEKISEVGKNGYFADGLAALNHTQAQMKLLQGTAAMCITGTWVGNEMADATPEGFEWGYMSIPFGDDPNDTNWVFSSRGYGYAIWAEKPEINKLWAKEFCLWMVNMSVQEDMAEFGGLVPNIRSDYAEDEARVAKVQDAPRAFMEYTETHNVKLESAEHSFMMTTPKAAQAQKLLSDSYIGMATGELDYHEILEELDELYAQALEE